MEELLVPVSGELGGAPGVPGYVDSCALMGVSHLHFVHLDYAGGLVGVALKGLGEDPSHETAQGERAPGHWVDPLICSPIGCY